MRSCFGPTVRIGLCCLLTLAVLQAAHAAEPDPAAQASGFAALPEPITSFGAAVLDERLYVYGGHTGKAHAHSKRNLSERFGSLPLSAASSAWESLPMQTKLQSVALAAHKGNLYRVGGMSARNEPDQPSDLVSVDEFARFDPKSGNWTPLAPLPEARSSHDAVVHDGVLYVIGGWKLGGKDPVWHETAVSISLDDPQAKWTELPKQTFQRRALAAAALGKRLYALGGMTSDEETTTVVDYFDLETRTWNKGPALPGKSMGGFGCTALGVGGRLYATTMEGEVLRLSDDGATWQNVGKLEQPRFFHRMLPWQGHLLLVGGASMKTGHLDSIEVFKLSSASTESAR